MKLYSHLIYIKFAFVAFIFLCMSGTPFCEYFAYTIKTCAFLGTLICMIQMILLPLIERDALKNDDRKYRIPMKIMDVISNIIIFGVLCGIFFL